MLRAIGRSDPSADGLDICAVGGSGPSVDIVLKRRVNL